MHVQNNKPIQDKQYYEGVQKKALKIYSTTIEKVKRCFVESDIASFSIGRFNRDVQFSLFNIFRDNHPKWKVQFNERPNGDINIQVSKTEENVEEKNGFDKEESMRKEVEFPEIPLPRIPDIATASSASASLIQLYCELMPPDALEDEEGEKTAVGIFLGHDIAPDAPQYQAVLAHVRIAIQMKKALLAKKSFN